MNGLRQRRADAGHRGEVALARPHDLLQAAEVLDLEDIVTTLSVVRRLTANLQGLDLSKVRS